MDKFVLNLIFGLENSHSFLKYITKENGKLNLVCIFFFFFFNCSRLEEEKKNVGKEENEKAETEKVKREAAQVTVSGPWSRMNTPFSLGKGEKDPTYYFFYGFSDKLPETYWLKPYKLVIL